MLRRLFRPPETPPPLPPGPDCTARQIRLAYQLILNRQPDPGGFAHYMERCKAGLPLRDLMLELLASDECQRLTTTVAAATAGANEPIDPALIDPATLIQQLKMDDLIETSDQYYRRVVDPTPLMSKPLTFLHEAPAMLENIGQMLAGLQLGKTMTVLDFGAGTGWLSRMLLQLQCRPICCDVSETALTIGKRLIDEHPLIGGAAFDPVFLKFDGHRLDLPDASVDRIVCFDAFHHVPNPSEVIAEFARVLKPGGIAGFSEPGRHHSRSPQSQYEMRNHQVLENDIDLNAIFAAAAPAGFTELRLHVLNDLIISLDEYNTLHDEQSAATDAVRDHVMRGTADAMGSRTIFFLHKGPVKLDSRGHAGLAHRIESQNSDTVAAPGRKVLLRFLLTNTGQAMWLKSNVKNIGIVRLASHLYDGGGQLIEVDFSRHDIPHDVAPGNRVPMEVRVEMPNDGRFRLGFDLVSEGVTWFENSGSVPCYVTVDSQ